MYCEYLYCHWKFKFHKFIIKKLNHKSNYTYTIEMSIKNYNISFLICTQKIIKIITSNILIFIFFFWFYMDKDLFVKIIVMGD